MEFIIAGNIPRMGDGEALIAVVHFPDSPAQELAAFFGSVTTGVSKCGMPL